MGRHKENWFLVRLSASLWLLFGASLLSQSAFDIQEALAADTGWKTTGNIVSAGSWTGFTTANLNASDDSRATNSSTGSWGVCSTYNFGVPAGARIDGIEVQIEGSKGGGSNASYAIQLSWDNGSSWTTAKTGTFNSNSDVTQTLGGATDTWGHTWKYTEFSNGVFRFEISKTAGAATLRVDLVQIRVYYTTGTFLFRKKATINVNKLGASCSSDLINFPVLISIQNDANLKTVANGGNVFSSSGYDIVFRASDGSTPLDHEIEKYDGSTGTLVAWVRIPILYYSQNNIIYMYYGDADITSPTANPTGVWDSNFKAVYHLKETSGNQTDSTSNGNHLTSVVVTTQGSATGQMNGADSFDGTDDYADTNSTSAFDVASGSSMTVEAWIKTSSSGSNQYIVNRKDSDGTPAWQLLVDSANKAVFSFTDNSGNNAQAASSGTVNNGLFHYLLGRWEGSTRTATIYVDGSSAGSSTNGSVGANSVTSSLRVGQEGDSDGGYVFSGLIDEVRFSNSLRDSCWIETSYNSMNSPDTFYTLGPEEYSPPTAIKLSSFTAMGDGTTVNVRWETKTEIDNLGFNLYRSTEIDGVYTKLNSSLIPGLISSVTGKKYSFTDADVSRGTLYYYRLEAIDLKGFKTMHGPVCIDWDRDGIPDDIDPTPGVHDSITLPSRDPSPDPANYSVTRITLHELRARQAEKGVQIEWRTSFEVNNLGFHVYREENGEVYRLTPGLIAGSALLAGAGTPLTAGHQYQWWDTSVISDQSSVIGEQQSAIGSGQSPVRYWLEDVDLSGERTMHGPVEVEPWAPGSGLTVSKYERPRYLSELGKKLEERYEEAWRVQEIRERLRIAPLKDRHASSVTRGSLTLEAETSNLKARRADPAYAESASTGRPLTSNLQSPQALAAQQSLAGRSAVKLLVKEEGWYRVSRSDLLKAGLITRVKPRFLQLYAEGGEVPFRFMKNDPGEPSSWEAIEFYGTGLDTLSTDTRVYWLVEGSAPGQRILTSNRTGGSAGTSSFPYTVARRDRTVYFSALKNGDESNWFGPAITEMQGAVDQILEVRNLDHPASGDAVLEVGVQGVVYAPHVISVLVNDIEVGRLSWSGQVPWTGVFSVPESYLEDGENVVTFLPLGGETDVSFLDYIRLTYAHSYTADEDELKCQAQGGSKLSIGGFSSQSIRVFDVTNERKVIRVQRKVTPDGTGGYRAAFTVPGSGKRTILALVEGKVKTPAEIRANQPSDWSQAGGYDLLVIAPRDFIGSVRALEDLRKSEGLSVGVVDMEDVYDEFNFGEKDPRALKDFLSHAGSSWARRPTYVLLVGDASFDPRDYMGYGDQDYVPTKLVDTFYMETASDDWFVDFDDDGLPDVAIGRLPVQTVEEADAVISKILGYGQSDPVSQALLVSDQVDPGDFNFEDSSDEVGALLPISVGMSKIYRGHYGSDAEAKAALLQGINQGPLLVNYVGHGSVGVWRGDVLTLADAEAMTNGTGLPFFVNMTCLNGFFQAPYTDSLAEALVKRPQGGAVAVWTSSGLTVPNEQALMNQEFIRLLFSEESLSVGEAARRAKAATTDQDVRRTWILFGDPSMRLKN